MSLTLSIPRCELKHAVMGLGKIINGKTTLPILSGVRFDADGPDVVAQATDLDSVARYRFADTESKGHGAFILGLDSLKELAKGSAKDTVQFETEDGERVIAISNAGGQPLRRSLPGMDVEEWPDTTVEVKTEPVPGFLDVYRRLQPFASRDETRYVLNGVCLDVTQKGSNAAVMVATDGRRLACQNTMNLPVSESCILRLSKFLTWTKLPADAQVGVAEVKDVKWISIEAGPWTFHTRAIDGAFPNWRQVVPSVQGDEKHMTLTDQDATVLEKAIPSLPGDDEILFVGRNGKVSVWARDPKDPDWTTLELPEATFKGDTAYFSLNRRFVADALAAGFLRCLRFPDELSPVYSEDGNGAVHVIMPMRCNPPEKIEKAVAKQREKREAAPEQPKKAGTGEPSTPQPTPAEEQNAGEEKGKAVRTTDKTRTRKETTVTKQPEKKNDTPALDRVLAACEAARAKVKEAGQALSELATAIKDAARDQKTQAKEVESARAALSKLQAISL